MRVRAILPQGAGFAQRPLRLADAAPMPDQPVMRPAPLFPRDGAHQLLLGFQHVVRLREAEAVADAEHVGIHRDGGFAEGEGALAAAWMDVYAWAVTMIEALFGERPWQRGSEVAELFEPAVDRPDLPVPDRMLTLLDGCLHRRDLSFDEIEREFDGRGYGDLKTAVGEAVADHLAPLREEFTRIAADKAFLSENYVEGARRAAAIADRVTAKAYKKAGFVDPRG